MRENEEDEIKVGKRYKKGRKVQGMKINRLNYSPLNFNGLFPTVV